MAPIPVLVLTGFLGSGKTTLLNRILSERHGRKIAVIENEFGEVGVDNDLVVGAEEEIFEMNNGCLCCTVRGDLIRILGNLAKRQQPPELVIIETTGMADPGPVAQTFFMDDDIQQKYQIQGIVTVVDALHITAHLDESPEAPRQVAFADLLLVNKVDLVSPLVLAELQTRLKRINAVAPQVETQMAELPLDRLWDLPGFRLDRALAIDEAFLSVERPFESALPLPPGSERFALKASPGPDPTALALLMPGETNDPEAADALFKAGGEIDAEVLAPGVLTRVPLDGRPLTVNRGAERGGWIYFEHHPEEFDLRLFRNDQELPWEGSRFFRPNHEHDDVTSVGLTSSRPLHPGKFQRWLQELLAVKGNEIYRSKGVLYLRGSQTKQVFQGVHMLLTVGDLGPWGQQTPETRMVFIGRNLDRESLTRGFERCLA